MKKVIPLLLFVIFNCLPICPQDTFSIVVVDTITGEIGCAGASCVGPFNGVGAYIISDVFEGIGAIHTQASWLQANKDRAKEQMLLGKSPQEIIDYMILNDAGNNSTIRQYGIVDLIRRGESAAFTGTNCQNYKNHATGLTYSVQGNILLGQVIIDTITNTFLRTTGPLADRLMAAIEAAKIVGADTRCAPRGSSSQSSFIKVVRIGDGETPYLLKIIPDSQPGEEPLTMLREQFALWKDSMRIYVDPFLSDMMIDKDSIGANDSMKALITIMPKNNSDTLLSPGKEIHLSNTGSGIFTSVTDSGNGIYYASVSSNIPGYDTISAVVISAGDTVNLFEKVVIKYTTPVSNISSELSALKSFHLYQNYPNPFNPMTRIGYELPFNANVKIEVYTVTGEMIYLLIQKEEQAGTYFVDFKPNTFKNDLSSGIYFYKMTAEDNSGAVYRDVKKMLFLK